MYKAKTIIFILLTCISTLLNIYLLIYIYNIQNIEQIIIDDSFIKVIKKIIYKIEENKISIEKKQKYIYQLLQIIKTYPK